jgi:hypothetical protein
MYDWILKYGENQQNQMRSGYTFGTEELARKHGENFVENANILFEHYPNAKIDVIKIEK